MPGSRPASARRKTENASAEVIIPDKLYFRIGEVSRLTKTKAYVLRFWETEFPSLKPVKSKTGHRLYRRQDVATILEIKRLLYERGFTISGARGQLKNHGRGQVAQPSLFQASVDSTQLTRMRDELRSILTILSRKC
jgi:DNA-binding transcriptional MerR regulator